VGLLKTLNSHSGKSLDAITLAEQACHVEIGMCGQSIGKQDQYAAALGGINLFQFNTNDSVTVERVELSQVAVEYLFSHILVFYTGETRSATELLNQQQTNLLSDDSVLSEFHKTKEFAFLGTELLRSLNVKALGELMDLAWRSKKKFSKNVSNPIVDVNYEKALIRGAFGGKLLGAGGGGFFLYLAPIESHQQIIDSQVGYTHISIGFEPNGSQLIFQN
jgi:D-glycero-alpha-D-manno-heptose-7-phosphate kinase